MIFREGFTAVRSPFIRLYATAPECFPRNPIKEKGKSACPVTGTIKAGGYFPQVGWNRGVYYASSQ